MKKFLIILVTGLLLSGCSQTTTETIGGRTVTFTVSKTEVEMWQKYKNIDAPYKVWGDIFDWQSQNFKFGNTYTYNGTLEGALKVFFTGKGCKKGCKVTHVGEEKISLERQKEIAEEYLPPGMVEKYFVKPIKKEKKKKEKQEEENQLAEEKREKEEEKIEKKKADDEEWF